MFESCENDILRHHKHDNCGCEVAATEKKCHECSTNVHDCECSAPEITFLKLMNPLSQSEILFKVLRPVQFYIVISTQFLNFQQKINNEPVNFYIGPPHLISGSKSFLIGVNHFSHKW